MTAIAEPEAGPKKFTGETQFATFYVGDMILGVDICLVQEINRQTDITPVPSAPDHVRGVINLRGDVATVIRRAFLAAERIIEGPPMSICSTASSIDTPSRATVSTKG